MRFQRPRRQNTGLLSLGFWRCKYQRLLLLFAGVVIFLFFSVNNDDSAYSYDMDVDSTAIHTKSATNMVNQHVRSREAMTKSTTTDDAKAKKSLLNLYTSSMESLPECTATRISLSQQTNPDKSSFLSSSNILKPAIFTDWTPPAIEKWRDRKLFVQKYGAHPQYVKGGDVQPFKNVKGESCTARTSNLVDIMRERFNTKTDHHNNNNQIHGRQMKDDILFFTNDVENPDFIHSIQGDYSIPDPILHHPAWSNNENQGFDVFSALEQGSSHPFHFHKAAWLGQVSGARLWYLLPPGTSHTTVGPKVNGCNYLTGATPLPAGAQACVQRTGEVFYLPQHWLHATCALEEWSVGVGGQGGSPKIYEQNFSVPTVPNDLSDLDDRANIDKCTASASSSGHDLATESKVKKPDKEEEGWKWFDGKIGDYYDSLERDEHARRNPDVITSYAVHRWMGPQRKTLDHYLLIRKAIYEEVFGKLPPSGEEPGDSPYPIRVFDAGCGLGAGLMWFEQTEKSWSMTGHTISEEQYKWITQDLPKHQFNVRLLTYDKPLGEDGQSGEDDHYHAIYSIEAAVHSPDLVNTIQAWSNALVPGGVVVIIDDFLSVGVSKEDPDVDLFARSWIANSVHSTTEVANMAENSDMSLVQDRDLGSQYQIAKLNYRNKAPKLRDEAGRVHQGWLGSKVRQKLFLEGKITYRMIVLRKNGSAKVEPTQGMCTAVAKASEQEETMKIEINPTLMTGRGGNGGRQQECMSGWYCCGKGQEYWDDLEASRTESTGYLKLQRHLFGDYLSSFTKHLTEFYQTFPSNYDEKGIFLDIGGTGSVSSGMKQVTTKFAHFAGPLEYWVLDSDKAAGKLSNAIVCDIDECPAAPNCGYDVTFSFTVLEHASRPWKSFDTIARITKKGGLTLHLVPWSYQWHATPADNYRFSHTALTTLLEDRGFEVLDVGYDLCNQPEHVLKKKKDEHFEVIWLTYVVGRKI